MPDQSAFILLIRQHRGILRRAAGLYTNAPQDREDLLQEIIYQLWKSYDGFAGRSEVSTWMYRVAMNVALHQLRKQKRRLPTTSIEELSADPSTSPEQEQRWAVIRQHLAPLSRLEKGILFLHLEEKSYAEIAVIIGISATNVGSKLTRIREKLRKSMTS
ncbi:MAG: RNA polymerase sigma factor [Bacteroidota bacterium]